MLEVIVTIIVTVFVFVILIPEFLELFRLKQCAGAEGMVGARGKVIESNSGSGWVQIGDERWAARSADNHPLSTGESVEVVAIEGLTAVVRQAAGAPMQPDTRSWAFLHPVRASALGFVVVGGSAILLIYSSEWSALLPFISALLVSAVASENG